MNNVATTRQIPYEDIPETFEKKEVYNLSPDEYVYEDNQFEKYHHLVHDR